MARGVLKDGKVSFVNPTTREQVWVEEGKAEAVAKDGLFVPESPEDYDRRVTVEAHEKHPGAAATRSFLGAATLGASDVAYEALQPGSGAALQEGSPVTSALSGIAGTVAGPGMLGAKLLKGATGLRRVGIAAAEGGLIGAGAGVSQTAMGADPSAIARQAVTGAAIGGAFSTVGLGLGVLGRAVVRRGQAPASKQVTALTQGKAELGKDGADWTAAKAANPKAQAADDAYALASQQRQQAELMHGKAFKESAETVSKAKPLTAETRRALEAERAFKHAENEALLQPKALTAAEKEALRAEEKLAWDRLGGLREREYISSRVVRIKRLEKRLAGFERAERAVARTEEKIAKGVADAGDLKTLQRSLKRFKKRVVSNAAKKEDALAKKAVLQDELRGVGFTAQEKALEARIASIAARLHPQTTKLDTAKVAARVAKNDERIAKIADELGDDMAHRSATDAIEGPSMALKAAATNERLAREGLERVASELGFAGGSMPRTGVFVGDLAQAGDRVTKALGQAQKQVFSFGVPGLSARWGGLGIAGLGGVATGSVMGGLAALAGIKLGERGVRKLVSAVGSGNAKSLSNALLGTGRVSSLASINLLTKDEVEVVRESVNQLHPEQTKVAALAAYKEGGVDDVPAEQLADFQARRMQAAQEVVNSGQSPAAVTRGLAVVREPRLFIREFAKGTVTSVEVRAFATVSPPVFNQMQTAARIALEEGSVKSPRIKRNIAVLLNGYNPYAQAMLAMYSAAKQQEQQQRGEIVGKQAGKSSGGRPPGTELQRIEQKGIGR